MFYFYHEKNHAHLYTARGHPQIQMSAWQRHFSNRGDSHEHFEHGCQLLLKMFRGSPIYMKCSLTNLVNQTLQNILRS